MHLARLLPALIFLAVSGLQVEAQIRDPTPAERGEEPAPLPGEVVSFGPDTPFSQFIRSINPLFVRATGKQLVDPTGRNAPIGFYISGFPYRDALDLVLEQAGLVLRETDRYFLIEPPSIDPLGVTTAAAALSPDAPTSDDREIRIDALIFELNLNRVREIGTNWGAVFGDQEGQSNQGQDQQEERLRLFLRTESVFDAIAAVIQGPDRIDLSELNKIFRLFETNGVGRTLSTPSIVVRSGQVGRFQSGSDIPVTLRDFAGNTVQQFVSTGVIVEASPRLISEEPENGPNVEFIHLVVDVEQSVGRSTSSGVIVDKNQGSTDLLFADGEQVLLGGLYSTEETISHRGIPLLKDIPLIGLLFGVKNRTQVERELLIVLKASLVDPITDRVRRAPPRDLIERERQERGVRLNQTQQGLGEDTVIQD